MTWEYRAIRHIMVVAWDDDPVYRQICEGGGFSGSALTATEDNFRKEVARWRRQRRRGVKLEEESEMPIPNTVTPDDDYREQLRRAEKAKNAEMTGLLNALKSSLA